MKTLEAIDFEKGRLLGEYNKKFKDRRTYRGDL